jgi:hypothetical protein
VHEASERCDQKQAVCLALGRRSSSGGSGRRAACGILRGVPFTIMSLTVAAALCLGSCVATAALARSRALANGAFAVPVMLLPLPWFVDASHLHVSSWRSRSESSS